jgi:hypothetical protein
MTKVTATCGPFLEVELQANLVRSVANASFASFQTVVSPGKNQEITGP